MTDPETRAIPVDVAQADREAAAEVYAMLGFGPCQHIIDGVEDDIGVVQAFARHRLAHSIPASVKCDQEVLARFDDWLKSVEECDPNDIVADGGITAGMVIVQEARDQRHRLAALTQPAIPVDVADLCERLRGWWPSGNVFKDVGDDRTFAITREAATALETLAAENARLHSLAKANNTLARMNGDRATKAEAENARLREALEPWYPLMADFTGPVDETWFGRFTQAVFNARTAVSSVTQVKESGR